MLSETEYEDLLMIKGCDAFKQTNYYFDTKNYECFNSKTVIRIRVKDGSNELTVKTKNPNSGAIGVIAMDEVNIAIEEETAGSLINGKIDIVKYLPKYLPNLKKKLNCVGSITTIRKKICITEGLPMAELDKSLYDEKTDFELEWEISENEYNKAIESLKSIGILLEDRGKGLSKYGRLIDRLRKER